MTVKQEGGASKRIDAGEFSTWLSEIQGSFSSGVGVSVPCGDCRGCCTSSYFIHIRPEDTRTLATVPPALVSPAPGLPKGHALIGYAPNGHCPLLIERQCSIYPDRPKTCREYDCRIFTAAGIDAGTADKATINAQVRTWEFRYSNASALASHEAVKAAARFIRDNAKAFPGGRVPTAPSDLAVLAIKVHSVFLDPDWKKKNAQAVAAEVISASRRFEARSARMK